MKEVRKNLRSQDYKKYSTAITEPINKNDIQNISGPSVASFTDNVNDIHDYYDNTDNVNDIHDYDNLSSSSILFSSSSLSSFSSFNNSFCETIEPSFRKCLASCFVKNNLTHAQGNSILHLLRTHPCFNKLPKDVRTLLNTPRARVTTFDVEPGEYIHFNFEVEIIRILSNACIVNQLELDFNIDGCSLDKSDSIQIWPIQCKIVNVQHTRPIIIGIYKGAQKLFDPYIFLQHFIADINRIMSNGGINFRGKKVPIRLRCFVADAPARAFILNHRGHNLVIPVPSVKFRVYVAKVGMFSTVLTILLGPTRNIVDA
jgi:hypothetical protein